MRFLHTSDWHVGKRLRGRSRDHEVDLALDQVVELTRDERIDVVLIAGDIWEARTTSPESDMIVFDALARLRATGATVVAIPGNHDSSPRLEALGRLLTPLGIVSVPRVMRPADGGVVEIPSRDGSESALIAAVPFVPERRFGDAASLFDDRATLFNAYDEGMGTVMAGMAAAFRPDRVNVLMGHLMIHGAKTGGGERELTIGMTYAVSPSRLPATAGYVALGHLHRPQSIPAAPGPARFAGSLLQLDFAEAGHHVGQCHFVEHAAKVRAQGHPDRLQGLRRAGVVERLRRLAAHAGERALDGADHIRDGDLGGRALEPVAAVGPALAAHQP